MFVCYLKVFSILTFFKAFNRVCIYGSDFSLFIFLSLCCILGFGFFFSFVFYILFRQLFTFFSLVFRNVFNFFFRYFLSFILDFILSVYRIRFFLLLGSSYYDPLSKVFLDNLSSLKGEFLMDFYNFSNKFLFENDFNVPLSLFSKLPFFDSSKNSFFALFLSRLFLNVLEHQNKLRTYFFFVNGSSLAQSRPDDKISSSFVVRFDAGLSFFEFLSVRLNSVFIDFFSFISLIQEYLYGAKRLSLFSLLFLKYFSFLKNIFLAILVHLEIDSFAHYIHVNLYRMALQRYYSQDDWKNLINTYDFSVVQSSAFTGDRRDDLFYFIKISFFYFVLGLNFVFFYVFVGFLALFQVVVYFRCFVSSFFDFNANVWQRRNLFIDSWFFSFNIFSFVILFFFKFFNVFCLWFKRVVYYWNFFRFDMSAFFVGSSVFDFVGCIYVLYMYIVHLLRVCVIVVYSLFSSVFFNYFRLLGFFGITNVMSYYSFISMCFRNFRDYFLYMKFRNTFFLAKLHSEMMSEEFLVHNEKKVNEVFFLKECFFLSLSHLYFLKYCLCKISRFYFLRFLVFRCLAWFLFWTIINVGKYTYEKFLNLLLDRSSLYSCNYFNIFIFFNLLIDHFFFFLSYWFEFFSNLFFCLDWRSIFVRFLNFVKSFFVLLFNLWRVLVGTLYSVLFCFNSLVVFFLLASLIFVVFVFSYFVFVLKFVYFFVGFVFFWFLIYLVGFCNDFCRVLKQSTMVVFLYLFFNVFVAKVKFYHKTIKFLRVRNLGFFSVLAILFTIRNDLKKYEIIHRNVPFIIFSNFYSDFLMNMFLARFKLCLPNLLDNKVSLIERLPFLSFTNFRSIMSLPYQNIRQFNKTKSSAFKTIEIRSDFFVEFEYHKYLRSRNFRNLKTFRFRKVLEPLDFYKDPNLDALSTFDSSKNGFLNFDPMKFFYYDDFMFYRNLFYFREVFSRRNLSFFYDDLDKLSSFRLKYSKISPLFRYFYLKRERLKYALTMYSFGNINNFSFTVLMNWILNYRILRATFSILKLCKKVPDIFVLSCPGFHVFRFLFFMDKFLFFYNYVCFLLVFFVMLYVTCFYISNFDNFSFIVLFLLVFSFVRFVKIFYKLDPYLVAFYTKPFLFSIKLLCSGYFRNVIYFFFQIFSFTHFGLIVRLFLFAIFLILYSFFYFGFQNVFNWLLCSECFFFFNSEDSYILVTFLYLDKCFSTFFVFNFFSLTIFFLQYFLMYFFFKVFVFKCFKILYFSFDISLLKFFTSILLFLNKFFDFLIVKLFKFSPILLLKELDLIIDILSKENNYMKKKFLVKSKFGA